MAVVTKGRFAELRGVTPGRVSQWIAAGWLNDALVGEGRAAQIDVEKAEASLRQRLDVGQVLGQGRTLPPSVTMLPLSRQEPVSTDRPPRDQLTPGADDDAARLQKAKADQAEMAAERERRKLAEERGVYILTSAAKAFFAKALGEWVSSVEIWLLNELAGEIAAAASEAHAQGKPLDRRSLVILLRTQFRNFRAARAQAIAARAAEAEPFVSDPDLPEDTVPE